MRRGCGVNHNSSNYVVLFDAQQNGTCKFTLQLIGESFCVFLNFFGLAILLYAICIIVMLNYILKFLLYFAQNILLAQEIYRAAVLLAILALSHAGQALGLGVMNAHGDWVIDFNVYG